MIDVLEEIPQVSATTGADLKAFEQLSIWHDSGNFIFKTPEGRYIPENSSEIRRDLKDMGYDAREPRAGGISEVDRALQHIQHKNSVVYAGPFAGKRPGLCTEQGRSILVTEDFTLIEPGSGDFPTIRTLVTEMLDSGDTAQSVYFYAGLKRGYESLAAGILNPGHVVAFVGPRACGKTLLQTLICIILGGRSANPFLWMTGATPFNSDLFRAENLMFGDEVSASSDIRTRRKFAATIKRLAADECHSCHKKQKEAVTLRPFWRVTFSVNDEPENLLVLPPLDDSVQDKLMVFKVQKPALFASDKWSKVRAENMATLRAEIPAFLTFLKSFEIPATLEDGRFGVRAFQHPDIKVALDCMSPEERMLELIDEAFFPEGAVAESGAFVGKASAIERRLVGSDSSVKESARGLLSWPQAASTYLARLVDRDNGRVTSKTARGGYKVFTISHPRDPGRPPNRTTIAPEKQASNQLDTKNI